MFGGIIMLKKFVVPIIIVGIFFSSLIVYGALELEPIGVLGEGEEWVTPYYVIDSNVSGPTIFIIGGTHGDELAGWHAALKLLDSRLDRGRMVIVPRANMKSVEEEKREIEGDGNLNRCYPGKEDGIPMEQLAFQIFSLIKEIGPDLVLDLHESREFHLVNERYLGQTLIGYSDDMTLWTGLCAIEGINDEIENDIEHFTLLQGPVEGSTTWAVGKYIQVPAFTVETSRKMELSSRINYQLMIVQYILKEFEVNLHWDI